MSGLISKPEEITDIVERAANKRWGRAFTYLSVPAAFALSELLFTESTPKWIIVGIAAAFSLNEYAGKKTRQRLEDDAQYETLEAEIKRDQTTRLREGLYRCIQPRTHTPQEAYQPNQ